MRLFPWRREAAATPAAPDRRQSLAGRPCLNQGVRLERLSEARVQVVVELQRRSGFFARFLPPVFVRRYRLDELGTFVVERIDGRRSAAALIDEFARHHRLNRREAELSVVQFLRMLMQRQAISIAVDAPSREGRP
jgi:hypothetical protein